MATSRVNDGTHYSPSVDREDFDEMHSHFSKGMVESHIQGGVLCSSSKEFIDSKKERIITCITRRFYGSSTTEYEEYPNFSNINEAVEILIQRCWEKFASKTYIFLGRPIAESVSSDVVFPVFMRTRTRLVLAGVVKAFFSRATFENEKIALQTLKTLSNKNRLSRVHQTVDIYAECFGRVNSKIFYMMHQSSAKGGNLKFYLREAFCSRIKFNEIKPIIRNTAKAFATFFSNINEAVEILIQSCWGEFVSKTYFFLGRPMSEGASGDLVFPVFMRTRTRLVLTGVVKAFFSRATFENEKIALQTLKTLSNKNRLSRVHQTVDIYAECFGRVNSKIFYMMYQSSAKGGNLKFYLREAFCSRIKFSEIKPIIRNTAKAFATLHRNTEGRGPAETVKYIHSIRAMLDKIESIAQFPGDINERLIACKSGIRTLIDEVSCIEEKGTIIHGDSNPGNIFAFEENDDIKITFIDVSSLSQSLSGSFNDEGKLPRMRDYSNFLIRMGDIYIRQMASKYMSMAHCPSYRDDEYRCLRNAFKNAYYLEACNIDKRHEHFQAIRSLLGTILRCGKMLSMLPQSCDEFKVNKITAESACQEIERISRKYKRE